MSSGTSPAIFAIHHVALRVADPDRSREFYATLLGLDEERRFVDGGGETRSVWLRAGGSLLMLERRLRGSGPEGGSGHLLAFRVSSLETWERRLADAGAVIEDRTDFTLYLRDPDGHRVGLCILGSAPPT